MNVIAIDPGNEYSGFVILSEDYEVLDHGKPKNEELISTIRAGFFGTKVDAAAIEMIACYGMAVGREVFETCVWIGKFEEAIRPFTTNITHIYRRDEKVNLCNSLRAKDTNIKQALIDRFGEVGTKKNPGFFYGFSKDQWAAMAIGVTYLDMVKGLYVPVKNNGGEKNNE